MTKTRAEKYTVTIRRDAQSNQVVLEQWRNAEGYLHRSDDLPAEIEYSQEDGSPIRQEWRVKGYHHRDGDEPAIIINEPGLSRRIVKVQYYKMGLEHREAGPATIIYYPENGAVLCEEWWENGQYSGGEKRPSIIEYDPVSGQSVREIFGLIDDFHRDHGPAIIERDASTGEIIIERFMEFGRETTPERDGLYLEP